MTPTSIGDPVTTPNAFTRAETPSAPATPPAPAVPFHGPGAACRPDPAAEPAFTTPPPTVTLPQGGGAIRGISETFQANPATVTAGFGLPLPLSRAAAASPPSSP